MLFCLTKLTMITNSRYILAFGFFNSPYCWQLINTMVFLRLASFLSTGQAFIPMCPLPGKLEMNKTWYFSSKSLHTGRADRLLWILMIHGSVWLNYCVANLNLITTNSLAHIGKSLWISEILRYPPAPKSHGFVKLYQKNLTYLIIAFHFIVLTNNCIF